MSNTNLLIGAISGNYSPKDIHQWVQTSNWDDCDRVLLVYNVTPDHNLLEYLTKNNITALTPDFDFWGNEHKQFNYNTAVCNLNTSYDLIHNIRFFHIWNYLQTVQYNKVLVTDVKDVYFNRDPFVQMPNDKLLASSEEIKYREEQWNLDHLGMNLGLIGTARLYDELVYNVGVFGGSYDLVKDICADIYLLSVGKPKVADQTSFNYLIKTKYIKDTMFTMMDHRFAVHLQLVKDGRVAFDVNTADEFAIIHQSDRITNWKNPILEIPSV